MKRWAALFLATLAAADAATADFFDDLDHALTWSSADAAIRARVSGTLDLEGYRFTQPAPALIDANGGALFNPRLVTFLDAQAGEHVYVFAQTRVDRGFDPAADRLEARLDEIAIRITPWDDARLNVQVGRFATVVSRWVLRHDSWNNPFITAPLVYENLTSVWDAEAASSSAMLLFWGHVRPPLRPGQRLEDKYLRLPLIWGPSYASGAAVTGELGTMTYAAEVKNASLSSRPGRWDDTDELFEHPTVSGRLGWQPNPMWDLGASASSGSYLAESADPTLAPGYGRGSYREIVLGQDASFAWHHFQAWAEIFETRFAVPRVGNADTLAYYLELRYRFAPQLTAAIRWNQQTYSTMPDAGGVSRPWSPDMWRIDFAPTYRFTPQIQLKLQYSLEHTAIGPRTYGNWGALQLVLRY